MLSSSLCVPDVTVTCMLSEDCVLPCNFQPGTDETVEWFRQDVSLYKFERNGSNTNYFKEQQLAERASISVPQMSNGNASLVLRRSSVKDRGTYRCHVRTSAGVHNAKVILKVEGELMLNKRQTQQCHHIAFVINKYIFITPHILFSFL